MKEKSHLFVPFVMLGFHFSLTLTPIDFFCENVVPQIKHFFHEYFQCMWSFNHCFNVKLELQLTHGNVSFLFSWTEATCSFSLCFWCKACNTCLNVSHWNGFFLFMNWNNVALSYLFWYHTCSTNFAMKLISFHPELKPCVHLTFV